MLNLGFGTYLLGLIVRGESWDFPGHPVVRNLPSSAGDVGSIPGWGTKPTCFGTAKTVGSSY